MGLEVASFISDLNLNWPLETDSATQGDDHLRLIKSVLKSVFPGVGGNGFSSQIIATEAEINALTGITGNIESRLKAASFPSGTTIAFYNAAPPPGWTYVNMPSTRMLVVGNSVGDGLGGSDNPLLNASVASHTHSTSGGGGTTGPGGSHTNPFTPGQVVEPNFGGAGNIFGGTGDVDIGTFTISSVGDHTHDLGGLSIGVNDGAANWTPLYCGLILCSKD